MKRLPAGAAARRAAGIASIGVGEGVSVFMSGPPDQGSDKWFVNLVNNAIDRLVGAG